MPGAVLYRGQGGHVDWHQHLAVQIIVADLPFELELEGQQAGQHKVAVVASRQRHRLHAASEILLVLAEPHGPLGRALAATPLKPADIPLPKTTTEPTRVIDVLLKASRMARPQPLSPPVLQPI